MKNIYLIPILLIAGCLHRSDTPEPILSFEEGVYASLFYVTEATGEYSVFDGALVNSMIVVDKPKGEWRLCSEVRCMENIMFDGDTITGTITEQSTYYLPDGKLCEYTLHESFTLMPVDDSKVDGWNQFDYTDCVSNGVSEFSAYILGVDIGIFY